MQHQWQEPFLFPASLNMQWCCNSKQQQQQQWCSSCGAPSLSHNECAAVILAGQLQLVMCPSHVLYESVCLVVRHHQPCARRVLVMMCMILFDEGLRGQQHQDINGEQPWLGAAGPCSRPLMREADGLIHPAATDTYIE